MAEGAAAVGQWGWLYQYNQPRDEAQDARELQLRQSEASCLRCLPNVHFDSRSRPSKHLACKFHNEGSTEPLAVARAERYRPSRS